MTQYSPSRQALGPWGKYLNVLCHVPRTIPFHTMYLGVDRRGREDSRVDRQSLFTDWEKLREPHFGPTQDAPNVGHV